MPKVSDEQRRDRTRQIRDAAVRAFARRGFQATSMADIISESGLSTGTIYSHFSGKADLIRSVANSILRDRLDEHADSIAERPPEPSGAFAASIARAVLHDLGDARLAVQVWGEAMVDERLRATGAEAVGRITSVLRNHVERWCLARGDAPATAASNAKAHAPILAAACHGFILQQALDDSFDAEAYLANLSDYSVS